MTLLVWDGSWAALNLNLLRATEAEVGVGDGRREGVGPEDKELVLGAGPLRRSSSSYMPGARFGIWHTVATP